MSLPVSQKSFTSNGKHTAWDEQHELTIQTEAFEAQVYVVVLHGSKIEQSIPGAQ